MKMTFWILLCCLFLANCSKQVNLSIIENVEYNGIIISKSYQMSNSPPLSYQIVDTFDVQITFIGKNYKGGLCEGLFTIANDSIFFNCLIDNCPPNADCGYLFNNQKYKFKKDQDSLFLNAIGEYHSSYHQMFEVDSVKSEIRILLEKN